MPYTQRFTPLCIWLMPISIGGVCLSVVNADVTELLQSWNNIKTAITSIETTKSSMTRKYQQLNGEWKDKKYKELGDVVHECSKALNEILKILSKGEKFIGSLAKSLQEYEDTTLGSFSNQTQPSNVSEETSRAFGASGGRSFFASIFNRNQNINDALKGVEYNQIQPATSIRSEQEIISSISGGDMTEGSCSSLAFAYAGNRAGYVVYDFRDGQSREVFSSRSSIEQIANMDGVDSVILRGTDDTMCAEQLMSRMEPGRQYYMATGAHAAIVRNNGGIYQYLELQSGTTSENGWHSLTLRDLCDRFGCEDGQSREYGNYLIELDSLQNSSEFLDLLGYINTDESAQMRGASGHVR